MRGFLTMFAAVAMLLPGQSSLAETGGASAADESGAQEMAAGDLSGDELKVNINKEDAATIAAGLDGIGLKRAEAIVRHREAFGPFSDIGELADVKGVGERTVAANAGRIKLE